MKGAVCDRTVAGGRSRPRQYTVEQKYRYIGLVCASGREVASYKILKVEACN